GSTGAACDTGGEAVGRAGARSPSTALRYIALTRRRTAASARRLEGIDASVCGSRAAVVRIIVARSALRSARTGSRVGGEAIRRAGAASASAILRCVALTSGTTADDGRSLEGIDAGVSGTRTVIGRIIVACGTLRRSSAARRR